MAEPISLHHRLIVDRVLGALTLHVDLPLHAPWTVIFGPSGGGKSSLLRAACGLLGQLNVSFSRLDPSGSYIPLITRDHATPPHRLGLGYAPQQGVLFPHLSVEENIMFPLTARGKPAARGTQVTELLELFDVAALGSRMPRALSGGERQRVNLARAFAVPNVRLLLLDEPFSGVGRELRDRLLKRMQAWTLHHGVPVLSVSHDVDEALLLGADVVVLDEGRVVRRGSAAQALAGERERMLRTLSTDI